jgi:hypothetical protein
MRRRGTVVSKQTALGRMFGRRERQSLPSIVLCDAVDYRSRGMQSQKCYAAEKLSVNTSGSGRRGSIG